MPLKLGTIESGLRYITIIIVRLSVSLMNVLQCVEGTSTFRSSSTVTQAFFKLLLLLSQYEAC
jgi:hypothetical protein